MNNKTDRQTPHTRDLILDEAERLIAIKGVYGFQLKEISVPLGIKVPAIYKHYKSKDDVLVAISNRFIDKLSKQFQYQKGNDVLESLNSVIDNFVDFKIEYPAYTRLTLVDFSIPGGMGSINEAAGGSFEKNMTDGPLALMHGRIKSLLNAGAKQQLFRKCNPLTFYQMIYGSLLLQLSFRDNTESDTAPQKKQINKIKENLRDIAIRYLKK